jgi:hypothetical protein
VNLPEALSWSRIEWGRQMRLEGVVSEALRIWLLEARGDGPGVGWSPAGARGRCQDRLKARSSRASNQHSSHTRMSA